MLEQAVALELKRSLATAQASLQSSKADAESAKKLLLEKQEQVSQLNRQLADLQKVSLQCDSALAVLCFCRLGGAARVYEACMGGWCTMGRTLSMR